MHSENFVTELLTNAEKETDSCPISQAFDYTYVVDNTISVENNDRRKYFRFNSGIYGPSESNLFGRSLRIIIIVTT